MRARWIILVPLLLLAALLLGWLLLEERGGGGPARLERSHAEVKVIDPFLQGRRVPDRRAPSADALEETAPARGRTSTARRDPSGTRRVPGIVLTDAGTPVPGLRVWTGAGPAVRTDEYGRFEVRASRRRDYVAFHAPPGLVHDERAFPVLAPDQDWVEIVLTATRSIALRLVGADGRPVGCARVHAESRETEYDGTSTTSSDGRAVLEGLQPGAEYEIYVSAREAHPPHPDARFSALTPSPRERTLTMPEPCWIEGVVVDLEGRPVGGALLEIVCPVEPLRTVAQAGSGRFCLGPVSAGRRTLKFSSAGGEFAEGSTLVDAPATGVRVRLAPLVVLDRRVELPEGESITRGVWQADGHSWWIRPYSPRPRRVSELLPDVRGTFYLQGSNGRFAYFAEVRLADIPATILLVEGGEISGVLAYDDLARVVFDTMGVTIEADIDLLADIDEPPFRIRGLPPGAEGTLRVVTGRHPEEETVYTERVRSGTQDLRIEIPTPD